MVGQVVRGRLLTSFEIDPCEVRVSLAPLEDLTHSLRVGDARNHNVDFRILPPVRREFSAKRVSSHPFVSQTSAHMPIGEPGPPVTAIRIRSYVDLIPESIQAKSPVNSY